MTQILVVVESPSKALKIGGMLGDEFVVQASGGHIRDLPEDENGYDADTLEPVYEVTSKGKESVKFLKIRAKSCSSVLLATDPDREGEAIAWHVAEVLGVKNRLRVKFHEITDGAVLDAVMNPVPLDVGLVRAQEARRVIDRLVGWMVSRPLSRAIGERASAGRVQSPSLGLVVEREREIAAFVPEKFFGVSIAFPGGWHVEWVPPGEGQAKCKDRALADRVALVRSMVVSECVDREEREAPPAPFDTAVMLQAASVALGFDPEKTMSIAQKLFQGLEGGHGFITYHRTDEPNLSDDAFEMIRQHCGRQGLAVASCKRTWKAAAGAQEAHEAIRPTDFDADLEGLMADERALYWLIHRRAVASQLEDAVYDVRRVKCRGDGFEFVAVGRSLKIPGWRGYGVAAEIEEEDGERKVPGNPVPRLAVGQWIVGATGEVVEGVTRAPGRYTKASLVAQLKAQGIGRPSTYQAAVDGLTKRKYVTIKGRHLVPMPVGVKIYDALSGRFSFVRVDFTRVLEEDLDAIAVGRSSYGQVVRGVYDVLMRDLQAFGGGA